MRGSTRISEELRRLERPLEGRLVAGVCAAAARTLDVDVTLLRLAFLVLGLGYGVGLLLYLLAWLLLPTEGSAALPLGSMIWGNLRNLHREAYQAAQRLAEGWSRRDRIRWPRPLSRRWIAVGLIMGGGFVLLWSLGMFSWLGAVRSIGLAAVAVGLSVLITLTPELRR